MARRYVCKVADVPANGIREFAVEGGLRLVVANSGNEYFGYQAVCPHQDVPLCEGLYDGSVLTCHMHLWQWDIRSGAPLGIAEAPLERYALAVDNGAIYVGAQPSALDVGELFHGLERPILEKLTALARREVHEAGEATYRLGECRVRASV